MSSITFCLYVNTIPLAAVDYNTTIHINLRAVIAGTCAVEKKAFKHSSSIVNVRWTLL